MKLQIIGFGLVAGLAVMGVDYSMQSRTAGLPLGHLGVAEYMDTVTARYDSYQDARELRKRQKQLAKIHLPEAPEGWTRREWADGDNSRIQASLQFDNPEVTQVFSELDELMKLDAKMTAELKKREVWVYERGDEIIALSAIFDNRKMGGSLQEHGNLVAMNLVAMNMTQMDQGEAYDLIQGVAYEQYRGMYDLRQDIPYRNFRAKIGDHVKLGVIGNASDESIHALLNAIDYKGLNAMLDQPDPVVGLDNADMSAGQRLEMARDILGQQRQATRKAVQESEQVLMKVVEEITGEKSPGFEAPYNRADIAGMVEQTSRVPVGLAPVNRMPGRKCERSSGNPLCGFSSD